MTRNIRDTPKLLVPWWRVVIKSFDGLEIKPGKVIGFISNGVELILPCQPSLASFWVVYGLYQLHGKSGGLEELERFPTKAEARAFYDRLHADYPNLSSARPHQPHGNYIYL